MAPTAAVGWLSSWPPCSAHCFKESPAGTATRAAGTATLPAALQLPPPVPTNTGSSCLVEGQAACVVKGMLCVTAVPDLQRQGAKDQCFGLKLITPANNPLFIKLLLFCWCCVWKAGFRPPTVKIKVIMKGLTYPRILSLTLKPNCSFKNKTVS